MKSILQQCYGDKSAVTDELVADILQPGLLPGAAAVFLDFLTYSSGPLPEDLLAKARARMRCVPPLALVPAACAAACAHAVPYSVPLCREPEEAVVAVQVTGVPVSILWGEKDPWEPIELGRAYADYACVEEFIALPGALAFVRTYAFVRPCSPG